jgi:hypothetical protein
MDGLRDYLLSFDPMDEWYLERATEGTELVAVSLERIGIVAWQLSENLFQFRGLFETGKGGEGA